MAQRLYPGEGEEYAEFPAQLLYGGAWAVLPTHAARVVYVAVSLLDPIKNEVEFAGRNADGTPWFSPDKAPEGFAAYRTQHPTLLTAIESACGIARRHIAPAIQVLREPIFDRTGQRVPLIDLAMPVWADG